MIKLAEALCACKLNYSVQFTNNASLFQQLSGLKYGQEFDIPEYLWAQFHKNDSAYPNIYLSRNSLRLFHFEIKSPMSLCQ